MTQTNNYILWLPGWYPNELEPFAGDFIQRHAQAVARYADVAVVHVVRDREGIITKSQKTIVTITGRLTEITVYYFITPGALKPIEKLRSLLRYNAIFKNQLEKLFAEKGYPLLSHVHVINKNAWPARWLKRKYNIPFVCSEQWTIYLDEARPNFSQLSIIQRNSIKRLLTEASGVSVVSHVLGKAITRNVAPIRYRVIPNLVDTTKFYPEWQAAESVVNFIHISNLNYQKNFEDIARAFAQLKNIKKEYSLMIFGPFSKEHEDLCDKLGISKRVKFHGEVEHDRLSALLRKANAMILYSRYETFGCVYIEAMASGVPVISSDIPVAHEIIEENFSGYFVEGENAGKLAHQIEWFINHPNEINKQKIADHAAQVYSPQVIGASFIEWYNELLGENLFTSDTRH